jgi:hypothetical protein
MAQIVFLCTYECDNTNDISIAMNAIVISGCGGLNSQSIRLAIENLLYNNICDTEVKGVKI